MIIQVEDLHKSYGSLEVLKGVTVSIAPKEVISIVGKSGAGKSTLLHLMGTLDQADQGRVSLIDTEVSNLSKAALARFRNKHIGFVFQFHHLLPEFTALENVCLPAMISGTSKKEAEPRAKELLGYLGLSDRMDHKPMALSGGEQQRVAVARALINQPAIVLADEPSGNLDSQSGKDLHQLFFRLRDDFGITFVIVTHNEELASQCDRRLVMADGKLV